MGIYSMLLAGGLAMGAPWWMARMLTTARYREGLGERLGRVPRRLRNAVAGRRVVWVHAVSVGEVLAVARLVQDLEAALPAAFPVETLPAGFPSKAKQGEWQVVVSTTTRAGQAVARQRFGADRVFYFPLDFAWAVRAYLRVLQPALLILAESELWPRLLHECARVRVPVAVVNARVSDRSFRRAWRVRRVWGRVLRRVTLFVTQGETDAERLRGLGAPAESVVVSGNLKYDLRAPQANAMAQLLRHALGDRPVVVAGSVVEGEEEAVASAFRALRAALPTAFLILAPRHPERFHAARIALEEFGAVQASALTAENAAGFLKQTETTEERGRTLTSPSVAVVLDTLGDLSAVYGLATVAFVGGSLVRRGGHNPLEPARFGVPVVMGPSFENFRDVAERLQAAGGVCVVNKAEDLGGALIELLTNPAKAHRLGERGNSVFETEGGATARSIQSLMPLIQSSVRVSRRGEAAVSLVQEVSA